MTETSKSVWAARDLALGGLFGALGLAVPIFFHALGPHAGSIFLPMYLPLLALGLMVSWPIAFIAALIVPLLSSLLTGMPPLLPVCPLMASELAALSVGASLARQARLGVWPAAIVGLLASRVAGFVAVLALGGLMGFRQTPWAYAVLSLGVAWPGVLLQLLIVPSMVKVLEATSLLGPRWAQPPKEQTQL